MLMSVLFSCTIGLAYAVYDEDNYPVQSIELSVGLLPPQCAAGYSGRYPNCVPPQRGYLPLPATYCQYPNCKVIQTSPLQREYLPPQRGYLPIPPIQCPSGSTVQYPNCREVSHPPPQTQCAAGQYPNCVPSNSSPLQREYITLPTPLCSPESSSSNCQVIAPPLPPSPPNQQVIPPKMQLHPLSPQCPTGSTGQYPFCKKAKQCPSGSFGIWPYCQLPPLIQLPSRDLLSSTAQSPAVQPPASKSPATQPRSSQSSVMQPPSSQSPATQQPSIQSPAIRSLLPLLPLHTCIIGWEAFKTRFNKSYADTNEEQNRELLFQENQILISTHNALYANGQETYSLCVNQFSDWTVKEYQNINGIDYIELPFISSDDGELFGADRGDDGDMKDWRDDGAVTEIKDQKNCASCWAFSATGALEGHFFIKRRSLRSLSEQQLMDCSRHLGNRACNKGLYTRAFAYTQSEGISGEYEYPYEARDNLCRATSTDLRNIQYRNITAGNEPELKDVVRNIGPVSIAIDANGKFKSLGAHGVYFNSQCTKKPTHAVLVIGYGYDKNLDMPYWLVKNSYGTTWGDQGFFRIARNRGNHCGLANFPAYPIV